MRILVVIMTVITPVTDLVKGLAMVLAKVVMADVQQIAKILVLEGVVGLVAAAVTEHVMVHVLVLITCNYRFYTNIGYNN